jgi:hypothetical protein
MSSEDAAIRESDGLDADEGFGMGADVDYRRPWASGTNCSLICTGELSTH